MFCCKELKLLYATVVLLLEAELLVNTGAMESKRSSILVAQNSDDLKSLELCTTRNQQRLGSVFGNFTRHHKKGHRRRTTTTSSTQTTILYTTTDHDPESTESFTTSAYNISTTYPKLPKPLHLSYKLNKNISDDVYNIDIEASRQLSHERHHTKHHERLQEEVISELDESSLSKSLNKVKKMYRDSTGSAVNKLSGKGVKNGIFLTDNCTTVIAQIGTTAILHCEVSDITENTVTWIRRKDYSLLSVGLVTYSADSRFFSAHGRHVKDKELAYAHVSDSQLEKYEEILKCKDEHIKDLENKVKQLQTNVDNTNDDTTGNLQQLLTRRLQGLAYFLDKLLSHKCVLGEEKKKLAESILEQSLALPVGLELDESMVPEEFTMDESNFDISQSMRIEDLTMMFGHHLTCSEDNNRYSLRKPLRNIPQADMISESECWSEPDRNVSLARVGLCDTGVAVRECVSENNRYRSRRSKLSYGSRSEDTKPINELALVEKVDELSKLNQQLEEDKEDLRHKLEVAVKQIDELTVAKQEMKAALALEQQTAVEANKNLESLKHTVFALETRIKDNEQQVANNLQLVEKLRAEKLEIECTYLENERCLRRAADEATVQASQAALERARAQHERLRIERELEETREKLESAMEANAQLEIEITRKVAMDADNEIAEIHEGVLFEEERPTSPDQGIDSDRLSSLEQNEINLSPRSLYEENATLKQKLARTKATLAETLTQLNAANMRKRSVQRAICREIHKTQGVLRKARDKLEHHN